MVKMASGMDHGRVRQTTTTTKNYGVAQHGGHPANTKSCSLGYIEYFMESACVRCLHTSCGVSEIEQVSEANEWDFWYKTTSV